MVATVQVKLLTSTAKKPKQVNQGDLLDLYVDTVEYDHENGMVIVHTGVAFRLPVGYRAKLYARSSTCNRGLILANSVGIIDQTYEKEVIAKFFATKKFDPVEFNKLIKDPDGVRLVQVHFVKDDPFEVVHVSEFDGIASDRGGFGSTGA